MVVPLDTGKRPELGVEADRGPADAEEIALTVSLRWGVEIRIGDPDAGLELRPEFEKRLRQAVAHVASDGQLLSMEELIGELKGASSV